jgi:protein-S-isoprenylcysteine O-methyltransferase Ste14
MRATAFEFRVRIFIVAIIYTLGFFSPWDPLLGQGVRTTMWLQLSSWITDSKLLNLGEATLFVTVFALLLGIAGTALRVWATAYLGGGIVTGGRMIAGGVVASGPFRHLRNPLYLGTWLLSFPIALLMPFSGAIFTLIAVMIFEIRLILGEEYFLARKLGPDYEEYKRAVPRLVPKILSTVGSADVRPKWMQAVASEVLPVGFTLCFAVFAWRYNAFLLTKCLLICFGVSLVMKALIQREK